MAKINNPLLSLSAIGALGKHLVFRKQGKGTVAQQTARPVDRRSFAQLQWRTMYQKAIALWHQLSPAEKDAWERQATPLHMTGFAYFISQALKPNPGIYLPLSGGTMTGDIDMDGHAVLNPPYPSWVLLADVVTPSNVDYVDFTGLDINTDGVYLLQTVIINPLGSIIAASLYREADYTPTNYYRQALISDGANVSSGRYNNSIFLSCPPGKSNFAHIVITKCPNGYLKSIPFGMLSSESDIRLHHGTITSANTTANITSLRVAAQLSGGIGAGSTLLLSTPRGQ